MYPCRIYYNIDLSCKLVCKKATKNIFIHFLNILVSCSSTRYQVTTDDRYLCIADKTKYICIFQLDSGRIIG